MQRRDVFNSCGEGVKKVWEACVDAVGLYTQCVQFLLGMWSIRSNTQLFPMVFQLAIHTPRLSVVPVFYTVSTEPTIITTKKETYL